MTRPPDRTASEGRTEAVDGRAASRGRRVAHPRSAAPARPFGPFVASVRLAAGAAAILTLPLCGCISTRATTRIRPRGTCG
ncbi:hypothetical protein MOTC310_14580 [Methylobacterium oryzae]|uniref:Uncharacterized protein n=1 Tax=Methylobacterium oryzae TaxID=334852 RepID=A0ABU7TQK7_9HYPH